MSFNERKNRKLKHAYYHNVLENDVCVASYTNILLIGLVGVDKDSDPAFDPQRSIAVKTSALLIVKIYNLYVFVSLVCITYSESKLKNNIVGTARLIKDFQPKFHPST